MKVSDDIEREKRVWGSGPSRVEVRKDDRLLMHYNTTYQQYDCAYKTDTETLGF